MLLLKKLGAEVFGYGLNLDSSNKLYKDAKISSYLSNEQIADIRDYDSLNTYMNTVQPEYVIHLAAQSLVRKSYSEPLETVSTNVLGTANVLIASLNTASVQLIINVTTDKVYKNDNSNHAFSETDELGGDDVYSGSKAAVEVVSHAISSSLNTRKAHIVNVRAGNVIGGGDWAEDRLIPDIVKASQESEPLTVRNPASTRPWQHVLDCLHGYLLLVQQNIENPTFNFPTAVNFGPSDSMSVQDVIHIFSEKFDFKHNSPKSEILQQEKQYLRLNSRLAFETLLWEPFFSVREAVERTAAWYESYFAGEGSLQLMQNEIQWFLEKTK